MADTVSGAVVPPRWNLETVFPGFDSAKYRDTKDSLSSIATELDAKLSRLEETDRKSVV